MIVLSEKLDATDTKLADLENSYVSFRSDVNINEIQENLKTLEGLYASVQETVDTHNT